MTEDMSREPQGDTQDRIGGESTTPARRKIIFYSTIGPDRDDAAWMPWSLASHALKASLDVEIFLAGPATGLVRREVRGRLEGRSATALKAVLDAGVPVSVAPG